MHLLNQQPLLPDWDVLNTNDPARACSHLSGLFRPHKVRLHSRAKKDAVNFQHNRAEFGNLSMNALRYGEEVTIDARNNLTDSYLVKFTLNGSSEVKQRKNVFTTDAGTVCVLNPSLPLKDHMSEDFEMLVVQVDGDSLRNILAEQVGTALSKPLEFKPAAFSISEDMASFTRLTKTICDDLADKNSGMRHSPICQKLEHVLMNLLLMEMPHSYSDILSLELDNPAPYVIRAAEEYIRAHLDKPITLCDLVTLTGTSGRSLQAAFKKYRGISPTAYIRNCRLDLARQHLLCKSNEKSITTIALDCGLSHLSKFAHYYKQRFGELPSETNANKRKVITT